MSRRDDPEAFSYGAQRTGSTSRPPMGPSAAMRSGSGLFYGNSSGSASEFGADRKYDAEYITRVKPENPDAVAPPSALRRSMSSRTGGTAMDGSESRGYIKRRVSWNANTEEYKNMSSRSLRSLPSIGSGQSLEDLSSRGTPSCLNHLLAYWSGCAPCVPKKLQQEDPVARMRCAPASPLCARRRSHGRAWL